MNALLSPLGTTHCPGHWRGRPYREVLALRDGRSVLLRPMHRSDAGSLQAFFGGLSPRSRLLRFHGVVNRVPDRVLSELTTQVPQQRVALVAMAVGDDGAPRLAAEARYVVDDELRGSAEFALTVADDFQSLGLGRALLQRLAVHADSEGLAQLHGSVMAGNEPMLKLLRGLGATLQFTGHDLRASFAIAD